MPSPSVTATDEASPAESQNLNPASEKVTSPTSSCLPEYAVHSQGAAAMGLSVSSSRWVLSTDRICSRRVFDVMMQDFLDLQYPLMPLFHRPSFRSDLDSGRETTDATFFSLLVTMCAALVANVPSTFSKYNAMDGCFFYQTRSDMVNHCHDVVMQLRRPEYSYQTTHEKWCIAYLLSVAHGNLNHRTCSMMLSAEADHHLRQMQRYHMTSQPPHSNIELQLHRKAICLSTIGYLYVPYYPLPTTLTFFSVALIPSLK